MFSIFLFLDVNDDVVVTIAVVVVIGEAGVGVDVDSVGVGIAGDSVGTGEKEGDLDFFAVWYRRYGIYKQQSLGAQSYPSKTKIIQNLQTERSVPVVTL
ncbi:hypothetical protein RhiirA4_391350 [Rhizophagus irregularis]|uniref:Uncharacterized protein n=1 Tax=Rhizophagus irregularis TaxID=588596 RepID=A0A2I1FUN0_9GLOM|nr:hypothetical protein RhiirA4_391350 [Rhizophagus irregularis]